MEERIKLKKRLKVAISKNFEKIKINNNDNNRHTI